MDMMDMPPPGMGDYFILGLLALAVLIVAIERYRKGR